MHVPAEASGESEGRLQMADLKFQMENLRSQMADLGAQGEKLRFQMADSREQETGDGGQEPRDSRQ